MKIILSEKQLALFNKNLLSEQTSSQVKEVQQKLNDCCKSGLSVDGIVGPATARAIKSCLGIDIINNVKTEEKPIGLEYSESCLTDEGFKLKKGGFAPPDVNKKYPLPDYYQKSSFEVGGKKYEDARAITSTNKNGYNFRVTPTGNNKPGAEFRVEYGNWGCSNGKLKVTLSGKESMKYPGDYGF